MCGCGHIVCVSIVELVLFKLLDGDVFIACQLNLYFYSGIGRIRGAAGSKGHRV